jgi:hypothetical protein
MRRLVLLALLAATPAAAQPVQSQSMAAPGGASAGCCLLIAPAAPGGATLRLDPVAPGPTNRLDLGGGTPGFTPPVATPFARATGGPGVSMTFTAPTPGGTGGNLSLSLSVRSGETLTPAQQLLQP